MTGSAPISFNGGTESDDRVSANTSCWFALRRRTSGRPIAPLAPAIRILIALPCSACFAAWIAFDSIESRHLHATSPCPLYPQERTLAVQLSKSALGQ